MALRSEVDIVGDVLREAGLSFTVERGRKHDKVRWFQGDVPFMYSCAKTPSDWRAALNVRARVRRMLRGSTYCQAA